MKGGDNMAINNETVDSLAYLYCKKHITEDTSVKDLVEMYKSVSKEIRELLVINNDKKMRIG